MPNNEFRQDLNTFRDEYKTRNKKCKHITWSHSCKKAERSRLIEYNVDCLYTEKYSNLPKDVEQLFVENNLFASHVDETNNADRLVRNKSSQNVTYSMNKKKRWLLPDIIQSYAQDYNFRELKPDKKVAQHEQDDDSLDKLSRFGLTAYFLDKLCGQRNRQEAYRYIDNNLNSREKAFNQRSLHAQINILPRETMRKQVKYDRKVRRDAKRGAKPERRLHTKEKAQSKQKSRPLFRFSDVPPVVQAATDDQAANHLNFLDANKIEYNFLMPRKILRVNRCGPLGRRSGHIFDLKKYKNSFCNIREYRRNQKDLKAFTIEKPEANEAFNIVKSSVSYTLISPVTLSLDELVVDSRRVSKTSPFTSLVNTNKKISLIQGPDSSLTNHRRIILIDECDAVCFDHLKRIEISNDTTDTSTSSSPQSVEIVFKPQGLYQKYKLSVRDKLGFMRSIQTLLAEKSDKATIDSDTSPMKFLLNLSVASSSFDAYLVIDLAFDETLLDSFYLNTNVSAYGDLDVKIQHSPNNFADINELVTFLVDILGNYLIIFHKKVLRDRDIFWVSSSVIRVWCRRNIELNL